MNLRIKSRVAGVIIGILLFVGLVWFIQASGPKLEAPNGTISIEIVDDEQSRRKGLSGREDIAIDEGMLFSFDSESVERCFWMKDMNFAIDIIWINQEKQVVHVASNVLPEAYPESYCPDEPAKYVLEVKAGQAAKLGIDEDQVSLKF